MGNVTDVKKELAKKPELKPIEKMIKASVATLGEALPAHMNAERLVRIALTTMRLNPDLYNCTPESFMGALFQSAQLGLEPNVEGQAYIIPFNNKRKVNGDWKTFKEAQFQIGYKGYVELFYRHKSAKSLDFNKVHEEDKFDFSLGTDAYIKHTPALNHRGDVIAYYAVAKLANDATVFKVMSKEECLEHGKHHSKLVDRKTGDFYEKSVWKTNEDAMCMKTVLIQLMKLLPKSVELQRAISADATVKTKIAPDMLAEKDEANWDSEGVEEAQIVPETADSAQENGQSEAPAQDTPPSEQFECHGCGAVISEKVHDFSVGKYEKPLCMPCQKKEGK